VHGIWIISITIELVAFILAALIFKEYITLRGNFKSKLSIALSVFGVLLTLENVVLLFSFYVWSGSTDLRYSMPSMIIAALNVAAMGTLYYLVRI
jgi:hypothetical protein